MAGVMEGGEHVAQHDSDSFLGGILDSVRPTEAADCIGGAVPQACDRSSATSWGMRCVLTLETLS